MEERIEQWCRVDLDALAGLLDGWLGWVEAQAPASGLNLRESLLWATLPSDTWDVQPTAEMLGDAYDSWEFVQSAAEEDYTFRSHLAFVGETLMAACAELAGLPRWEEAWPDPEALGPVVDLATVRTSIASGLADLRREYGSPIEVPASSWQVPPEEVFNIVFDPSPQAVKRSTLRDLASQHSLDERESWRQLMDLCCGLRTLGWCPVRRCS